MDINPAEYLPFLKSAKKFLGLLLKAPVEEVGLLMRDRIAFYRFKNQVKILEKTRLICEQNNISIASIPLKILIPLIENAGLEEDELLQDKWAVMLSNLVDAEQNVQNHVFPFLLGQISKEEYSFLESIVKEQSNEISDIAQRTIDAKAQIYPILIAKKKELENHRSGNRRMPTQEYSDFLSKDIQLNKEVLEMNNKFYGLKKEKLDAECFDLEFYNIEFQIYNLVRLGLVKVQFESHSESKQLQIYNGSNYPNEHDFVSRIETYSWFATTDLCRSFIDVCTEKLKKDSPLG